MATITIDKIIVEGTKIHLYEGKISYIFGDIQMMEAKANPQTIKAGDEGIIAACAAILGDIASEAPDVAKYAALAGISNRVVNY